MTEQFHKGLTKAVEIGLHAIRIPLWSAWRGLGAESENLAGAMRRSLELAFLRSPPETRTSLRDMIIEICIGRPQYFHHFKSNHKTKI